MCDKDKGSVFLYQILFMFSTQIFSLFGLFLEFQFHIHAFFILDLDLVTQILQHTSHGVCVFDTSKWFLDHFTQILGVTVKFRGTRVFLTQKFVLRLAPIQDGGDHVFDKAFGLIKQTVQGDKVFFVFDVQKLGQMFVGIRLFSTKRLLACVDTARPHGNGFQWQLRRYSQTNFGSFYGFFGCCFFFCLNFLSLFFFFSSSSSTLFVVVLFLFGIFQLGCFGKHLGSNFENFSCTFAIIGR
mmetsp:Transcript_9465/g.12533  ORF Transcript_9465/g.12533 Transcript_9465/m.12533 type:complete len:241 (-) Transcript_9465:190-912(-)